MLKDESMKRFKALCRELRDLMLDASEEEYYPFLFIGAGVVKDSEDEGMVENEETRFYFFNTTPEIIMDVSSVIAEENKTFLDGLDEMEERTGGADMSNIDSWLNIDKKRLN